MMNSNLKKLLVLIAILFISISSLAQEKQIEKVHLIEKLKGKRLELFAKNEDSISYSIFLRVTTTDYRRSSNRPILTTVEPNTEKYLITLIKLADKPGNYEKQFIVNEVSQKLSIRKDFEDFEINFDNALKTKEITIYNSDDCEICEDSKILFTKNKMAFNSKHIVNENIELLKSLKSSNKTIDSIKIKQN